MHVHVYVHAHVCMCACVCVFCSCSMGGGCPVSPGALNLSPVCVPPCTLVSPRCLLWCLPVFPRVAQRSFLPVYPLCLPLSPCLLGVSRCPPVHSLVSSQCIRCVSLCLRASSVSPGAPPCILSVPQVSPRVLSVSSRASLLFTHFPLGVPIVSLCLPGPPCAPPSVYSYLPVHP